MTASLTEVQFKTLFLLAQLTPEELNRFPQVYARLKNLAGPDVTKIKLIATALGSIRPQGIDDLFERATKTVKIANETGVMSLVAEDEALPEVSQPDPTFYEYVVTFTEFSDGSGVSIRVEVDAYSEQDAVAEARAVLDDMLDSVAASEFCVDTVVRGEELE